MDLFEESIRCKPILQENWLHAKCMILATAILDSHVARFALLSVVRQEGLLPESNPKPREVVGLGLAGHFSQAHLSPAIARIKTFISCYRTPGPWN